MWNTSLLKKKLLLTDLNSNRQTSVANFSELPRNKGHLILCDYIIITVNAKKFLRTSVTQVSTFVFLFLNYADPVRPISNLRKDMVTVLCLSTCQIYSSLFMRQVCFSICMVVRSVELARTSRTSSWRSSSVSASRARFFSCNSICNTHNPILTHTHFFKGITQQPPPVKNGVAVHK